MCKMSNKNSLNNGAKEAAMEGEGFLPGRGPVGKKRKPGLHISIARMKWSKEDNKIAILSCLQAKERPNIGYRKRMHQYWKDYGMFELVKQHLVCQVRSILKTGKLSKVETEVPKKQIKKLHEDSVKSETGKLHETGEEVMTQSDDVLLHEFTAGTSGYVEDAGVIESDTESDITKRLNLLHKNPINATIPSLQSGDALLMKWETEEVDKPLSSIILNDISDFKNLIKADETIVCERMGIKAPARTILEVTH